MSRGQSRPAHTRPSPSPPAAPDPDRGTTPGRAGRTMHRVQTLVVRLWDRVLLFARWQDGGAQAERARSIPAPLQHASAPADSVEAVLLVPATGEAPPAPGTPAGSLSDDVDDARVLPFILLHRSRMHAVDLRRALDGFQDEDGNLVLRPGEVRTHTAYRLDVMVQVSVELVLGSAEVQARLTAEPEFRRLVHDAVYYVSRRWVGAKPLDMSEESGLAAFRAYLLDRMDDTGRRMPGASLAAAVTGIPGSVLAEADLRFLFDHAHAVARLLSDRAELRRRFTRDWRGYRGGDEDRATAKLLSDVMGLEGVVVTPPLYPDPDRPGCYGWRCDRSGRSLVPAGAQIPATERDPEPEAKFIRAMRHALATLSHGGASPAAPGPIDFGPLASELHVLSSSPAWGEVEAAVEAFTSGGTLIPGDRRVLAPLVRQFAEMLCERGEVLGLALLAGAALGQAGTGSPEERLARGLRVLAEGHRFGEKSLEELRGTIHGVREGLRRVLPAIGPDPQIPRLQIDSSVAAWARYLEEQLAAVRLLKPDLAALRRDALGSSRGRVSEYLIRGARLEPRVEELLIMTSPEATSAPVQLNLAAMKLRDWSGLAYDALVAGATSDPWFGLAALAALGFRTSDWRAVVGWLMSQRLYPDAAPRPFDVEGLPTAHTIPDARAVVVVRRSTSSLTDGWLPDPQVPALVLTTAQARNVVQRVRAPDAPPLHPAPALLAFEMPPDEGKSDDKLLKMLQQRVPADAWERRIVYLYPEIPSDLAKTPYVPAPRELRELLAVRGAPAENRGPPTP